MKLRNALLFGAAAAFLAGTAAQAQTDRETDNQVTVKKQEKHGTATKNKDDETGPAESAGDDDSQATDTTNTVPSTNPPAGQSAQAPDDHPADTNPTESTPTPASPPAANPQSGDKGSPSSDTGKGGMTPPK